MRRSNSGDVSEDDEETPPPKWFGTTMATLRVEPPARPGHHEHRVSRHGGDRSDEDDIVASRFNSPSLRYRSARLARRSPSAGRSSPQLEMRCSDIGTPSEGCDEATIDVSACGRLQAGSRPASGQGGHDGSPAGDRAFPALPSNVTASRSSPTPTTWTQYTTLASLPDPHPAPDPDEEARSSTIASRSTTYLFAGTRASTSGIRRPGSSTAS